MQKQLRILILFLSAFFFNLPSHSWAETQLQPQSQNPSQNPSQNQQTSPIPTVVCDFGDVQAPWGELYTVGKLRISWDLKKQKGLIKALQFNEFYFCPKSWKVAEQNQKQKHVQTQKDSALESQLVVVEGSDCEETAYVITIEITDPNKEDPRVSFAEFKVIWPREGASSVKAKSCKLLQN